MPALLLHYHCPRCRHRDDRESGRRREERPVPDAAVTAPRTPAELAAAAEVFAWLNRQLSWQSALADLEAQAGFPSTI